MSEIYTTGNWKAKTGSEEAFVDAWTEFATWASSMPGAGRLRLVRDLTDQTLFVSFGDWQSIENVRAWKSSREFRERMMRVQQHVADFHPGEHALVATVEEGAER